MNRTNTSSVNITRSEFQSLLNEVKALKTAVDQLASKSLILELIQLISPLFPQDINLYNASNDIEEAAQNGKTIIHLCSEFSINFPPLFFFFFTEIAAQ